MSYDPTNTHQGCTEKIQAKINALSRKGESAGSICDVQVQDEHEGRTLKITLQDPSGKVAERVIGDEELKALIWGKRFDFLQEVNSLARKLNDLRDLRGT